MTGVATIELKRKAILSDLSQAAVIIASNLTTPIGTDTYTAEINKICTFVGINNFTQYSSYGNKKFQAHFHTFVRNHHIFSPG